MKKVDMPLIAELLKDSRKSDREIAKTLKVSQPTITRARHKLARDGLIKDFSVFPEFTKLGFEILAISSFFSKESEEIAKKAEEWTASKPNILFAARAEGERKNAVVISVHKSYAEYHDFIREIKSEGAGILQNYDPLLISLKGPIAKPFSLKYLAELITV